MCLSGKQWNSQCPTCVYVGGTSDQGGFEAFPAPAEAARSSPIDTFPLIPPQTGFKKVAEPLRVDAKRKKAGTILSDLKRKDFAAFYAHFFLSRTAFFLMSLLTDVLEQVKSQPGSTVQLWRFSGMDWTNDSGRIRVTGAHARPPAGWPQTAG